MRKPDFLIVGLMKSGTSSLARYLSQHSQTFVYPEEIHFFDKDENYDKGKDWYLSHFSKTEKKIVGEKTPTYMYLDKCPKRIYNFCPNTKLIFILRNPVDRSYSNYLHAFKKGVEGLSFEEAIKKEKDRIKKDVFKGYLKRSKYINQINEFRKYFPFNQMHFIILEQFKENPKTVFEELFTFLDVKSEKIDFSRRHNVSKLPCSPKGQRLINKYISNKFICGKLCGLNKLLGKKDYKPMKQETRIKLNIYFRKYNKRLSILLGKNLDNYWDLK